MNLNSTNVGELSDQINYSVDAIKYKSYGKYLEDFTEGTVFKHPRGMTISAGLLHDFATTYLESNPLYLNQEYAKDLGHPSIPASPLLVMNIALSLGVQNNSEKAYANLGYYNMHFLKPVYAGDTLVAYSKVAAKRERGESKPGIITLHTIANNQKGERVIQYERKIMVPGRPEGYEPPPAQTSTESIDELPTEVSLELPNFDISKVSDSLTRNDTYYEDFNEGDIIVSPNGRTITDEHFAWTYKVGNTHPLHFDKGYSKDQSGAMSGDPIVYGGLVFAWLLGLASRDTSENAIWDLGYTEGYHTQPAKSDDTIYVISRVLKKEIVDSKLGAGVIQFQVIGLKNQKPKEAIEKNGADLFMKENNKKKAGKEKIPHKIFEIERKLLIRSRGNS